jgi:hypothetical protein
LGTRCTSKTERKPCVAAVERSEAAFGDEVVAKPVIAVLDSCYTGRVASIECITSSASMVVENELRAAKQPRNEVLLSPSRKTSEALNRFGGC